MTDYRLIYERGNARRSEKKKRIEMNSREQRIQMSRDRKQAQMLYTYERRIRNSRHGERVMKAMKSLEAQSR